MDTKVNLESLLFSYYIKYDRLLPMVSTALADIQGDTVDIYVDIYDMLKPVYTKEVYADKQFLIVSSIINLAAHLRGYFRTRHRLYTRIYLVYGESISDSHTIYYPSFRDDSFRNTVNYLKNNEFIKSQLQLLQILCGYIPDVYYIARKSDFSVFAFDNINKNVSTPAIVLTKSVYAYQIPAFLPQAKVFRPKKTMDGDVSFVVSKPYVYGNLYNKIKDEHTLDRLSKINPSLCSLMITLTGLPSYNMRSLFNVRTSSKMILDTIESGRMLNDYSSDITTIYNSIAGLNQKIDLSKFVFRFKAADIISQHMLYNSTIEAKDITWHVNFNDPKTVRDINNKYFIDNPLDLNNL